METGYLRSCAGCSAHILLNYSVDRPDENPAYCRKCVKNVSVRAEVGDRVRIYSRGVIPGVSEFIVVARDGDTVTVKPLGHPDADPFEVSIGNVMPEFRY